MRRFILVIASTQLHWIQANICCVQFKHIRAFCSWLFVCIQFEMWSFSLCSLKHTGRLFSTPLSLWVGVFLHHLLKLHISLPPFLPSSPFARTWHRCPSARHEHRREGNVLDRRHLRQHHRTHREFSNMHNQFGWRVWWKPFKNRLN